LQLTGSEDSASAPAFSPDGRHSAFLSKRGKDKQAQIWLLDRRGGEAQKLTDVKADIAAFRWSPDPRRLLLTITDPAPEPPKDDEERPLPVVVDDVKFKEDGVGFLTAESHTHLALFDVATKTETRLTASDSSTTVQRNGRPMARAWPISPITRSIPKRLPPEWLHVVEAKASAAPRVAASLMGRSGRR